jgi:hypothetical protein
MVKSTCGFVALKYNKECNEKKKLAKIRNADYPPFGRRSRPLLHI